MTRFLRYLGAYAALCTLFLYALFLLPSLQVLAGCAALGPSGNAALEVAVKYGVAKLVEESDDVTAEKVVAVANALESLVDGNPDVTVSELEAGFADVADLSSLSPADRYAVAALASAIADALREEFPEEGEGVAVAARTLFEWVRGGAALAGSPGEAGFPLLFFASFLPGLRGLARRAFSRRNLLAALGALGLAAAGYQAVACSGALGAEQCAAATAASALVDALEGLAGDDAAPAEEPAP